MTHPTISPRLRPVIRVFVSSTFSDMRHERDALQAEVFPKLEQLCQKDGFQFQAIDLRWGVSSEAGLDHRTMRICLEELRRSQEVSPEPNFLVLLGDRYGWRPLPEEISRVEFDRLVTAAESGGAGQSPIAGTHGKTARHVLEEWYRRDENVLLSDPPETGPDRASLNYILQPRTQDLGDGRDYTRTKDDPPKDTQDWLDVQQVLWSIINAAFPAAALDHRFENIDWTRHADEVSDRQHPKRAIPQIARFQASATEQEIWGGALSAPNAERHVLAFFRELANRDDFAPAEAKEFFDLTDAGQFDPATRARQNALKAAIRLRLGADAVGPIPFSRLKCENGKVLAAASPGETAQFCKSVEDRLRPIIERQIEQYWHPPQRASVERTVRELEIEQQEHARIGQERGGPATFVGRADKLKAIREYLSSESTAPLVIHGASGCGKTALMARAAQDAGSSPSSGGPGSVRVEADMEVGPPDGTKVVPIVRFLGTTPRSSDLRGLLTSLCQELRLRYPREGELPTDIKLLEAELQEQIKAATPEQPLILFLDALDQLADTDGGRNLHWIPIGLLPANMKLVVSCLSDRVKDDPAGQPYAELQRRQLQANQNINLDAFSEAEARMLLFDRWLPQAGRTVSGDQRARIDQRLASAECRQPIYLKLLFEEARLWRSYDAIPDLGENVPALLKQLFDRLSRPTNHGQLLVERVWGYLAASREGLAENEILEILLRDPEYKKALDDATKDTRHEMPPNATRIPIAIWSRLRFDLASYLTERAATGADVLTFYHRQVAEWVHAHFATTLNQRWQPHPLLADYFRDLADPDKSQSWKGESPRPFLQVVFHLVGAERSDDYCQTLCDLRFIEARCRLSQVFELIADYRLAQENLPEAQADLREERERQERVARWTREIIEYSRQWSDRRDAYVHGEVTAIAEPVLPAVIHSIEPWSDDKIEKEARGLLACATRLDRVQAFARYVTSQSHPLRCHGNRLGFVVQHAFNNHPSGPVHESAARLLDSLPRPFLVRRWRKGAMYSPSPTSVGVLQGHASVVEQVCITSDGRRAASASRDGTLRIWELDSGECVTTLLARVGVLSRIVITPDGGRLLLGNEEGVSVWDVRRGECMTMLRGLGKPCRDLSITPDGRLVAAASESRRLEVWDVEKGVCIAALGEYPDYCSTRVAIAADGRWLLAAANSTLRVWNLDRSTCVRTLEVSCRVDGVCITPDGRRAVCAGSDLALRVWDLDRGLCVRTLQAHSEGGRRLSMSMTVDGRLALSASYRILRLWDLDSGECLRTFQGHSSTVRSVGMAPDGARAVSGGWDTTLRVWNLVNGVSDSHTVGHAHSVYGLCMTPDGCRAVSAGGDEALRVWDVKSAECLSTLGGHHHRVLSVSVTPNGKCAVSGGEDCTLRLWDLDNGTCVRTLCGHRAGVLCVTVTPDGRRAVSACTDIADHLECVPLSHSLDRTTRVWDLETGECIRTFDRHFSGELCLGVTPDGCHVVSGGAGGLCLWDMVTGERLRELDRVSDEIRSLAVTLDGRMAVSASRKGQLQVWDLRTGKCLESLDGQFDWFCLPGSAGLSLTDDGRHAVSVGKDRTLRLWDIETGGCGAVFCAPDTPVAVAASSAPGAIVCGTAAGEVVFMELQCLTRGPAILTAPYPEQRPAEEAYAPQVRCVRCGGAFEPQRTIINTIKCLSGDMKTGRAPCLDLPASAFSDSRLLSCCPHCHSAVKFNPFFSSAGDYAEELRRGLEYSRHARGPAHEETLAHLAALAVHLEATGRHEEAVEFEREHDALAAQVGKRK